MLDLVRKPYAGIVQVLGTRPFLSLGEKIVGRRVPIFMLHRFASPALGVDGHDPDFLRWALEYLRGSKFNFVSVEDVAKSLRGQCELPPRPVAFSLDDGFYDQADIGGRIFADYDCPATYFVTTGFASNEVWFWDSKVEYMLDQCDDRNLERLDYQFKSLGEMQNPRKELIIKMIRKLKSQSLEDINKTLRGWSEQLEVKLPEKAPEKFAPASWGTLDEIQRLGMKIAPHTYSHPLLSREEDGDSHSEIARSVQDLKTHLADYSNVFAYPVGRAVDFGKREEQFVEELGFLGAVSAIPGSVDQSCSDCLFSMPRFGFPDTKKDLIQYASWIEALKSRIRA